MMERYGTPKTRTAYLVFKFAPDPVPDEIPAEIEAELPEKYRIDTD